MDEGSKIVGELMEFIGVVGFLTVLHVIEIVLSGLRLFLVIKTLLDF